MRKLTTKEFVNRSISKHGYKYDYSKSEYVNQRTKITVICDKHGEFNQLPSHHMNGRGCNECAKEYRHSSRRSNTEDFIKGAKEVHGDLYDYSKVDYVNDKTKVLIVDKEYGEFYQTPHDHLFGKGCSKRGTYNASQKTKNTLKKFINQSMGVHGDKYDYSLVDYINCRTKVKIICPIHGEFKQSPISHIYSKHGCPTCGITESKIEDKIKEFLNDEGIQFKERDRTIIKPFELDIVIKDFKLAIEVNGIVWHSEKFNKDKNYHLNKTIKCNNAGYRLLHFFEDEINNDFEHVKRVILDVISNKETFNGDRITLNRCIYNEPPNGYRVVDSTGPLPMYSKNKSRITVDEFNNLENTSGWYKIWDCGNIICERINN